MASVRRGLVPVAFLQLVSGDHTWFIVLAVGMNRLQVWILFQENTCRYGEEAADGRPPAFRGRLYAEKRRDVIPANAGIQGA